MTRPLARILVRLLFVLRAGIPTAVVPDHPLHHSASQQIPHRYLGAQWLSDGYGPPAQSDVGHYLHHSKFECNYGTSCTNYLDRALGTYEDGSECARCLHTIVMSDVSRTTVDRYVKGARGKVKYT